jgi:transcriptional regulator with XRE-family HTH domain
MLHKRLELGNLVRAHRDLREWSQEQLAAKLGRITNRSAIAHLEQGIRIPKPAVLTEICNELRIPPEYWKPFTNPDSIQRLEFEEILGELVGDSLSMDGHDEGTKTVVEERIRELLGEPSSTQQTLDRFCSIMVYYGVPPVSEEFFKRYFKTEAFSSIASFDSAVRGYQKDAIRVFSTMRDAYRAFNQPVPLEHLLAPIHSRSLEQYSERDEWKRIVPIPDERLADLGYISAARVKQESVERQALKEFLEKLASAIRTHGKGALQEVPTKTLRKMDSYLRKFDSSLQHGFLSPLFVPDSDELQRDAARLAPSDDRLARIAETQSIALSNLSQYLSADYMDVYVATSMRSDADFISVNQFVRSLFAHEKIKPLKLRYFNPTQSWIDDRIAKGLVEAIMLRRASVTIYMAQKNDTFGKDCEASVSLGQGKPVIVYVPKLILPNGIEDTEALFKKNRDELLALLQRQEREEIDDTVDNQAVISKILAARLQKCTDEELSHLAASHWADFDLYNEADRIANEGNKASYRHWLDNSINGKPVSEQLLEGFRADLVGIFVATAVRFENRAKLFREMHPLAFQVILSSGVLNGILVVRSVEQCATVLNSLTHNNLELELQRDERNYKLIEKITGSTIRVISRHRLLRHAFQAFYGRI